MNGIKYILDTNALISFLQGNPALGFLTSAPVGISIISILEFLSFPAIDETAKSFLFDFAEEIEVFNLKREDHELINIISSLKIKLRLNSLMQLLPVLQSIITLFLSKTIRAFLKFVHLKLQTFK